MFTFEKKMPSYSAIKDEIPFERENIKQQNDALIKDAILLRNKFVVVCGPCSADDTSAVFEYCEKLARINEKISQRILLVPRIFTVKPRSKGEGYLGMLYSCEKNGKTDIEEGIRKCRKMLIECISITNLPLADEILYPEVYPYFSDLISYYFVGARTGESALHRDFASGIDVPVGIKNNTGGDLSALAQSVYCASQPKQFLVGNSQYQTSGNKYAHAVLRGYLRNGEHFANFSQESLTEYQKLLPENCNKFVLVDCSHSNSAKNPLRQIENAVAILCQRNVNVGGVMLESYLYEGKGGGYGYSKTDPCISIVQTENLLLRLYDLLSAY